jgi:hypothetical protein
LPKEQDKFLSGLLKLKTDIPGRVMSKEVTREKGQGNQRKGEEEKTRKEIADLTLAIPFQKTAVVTSISSTYTSANRVPCQLFYPAVYTASPVPER